MSLQFGPAATSERIVYGARRPCHPRLAPSEETITDWIDAVEPEGIERVCCLLDEQQRQNVANLLNQYRDRFGENSVCHAPIPDFTAVDRRTFHEQILPFLDRADADTAPLVVHCSAGSGRTGHVLALWLSCRRGYDLHDAVETVESMGRNPPEAATPSELEALTR